MPNWTGKDYGAFAVQTTGIGVKKPVNLGEQESTLVRLG